MTFTVGDPGHVYEHNNIAAQALDNSVSIAARVTKGSVVIDVDDQVGLTDDIRIDAAIAAASASVQTRVIRFSARQYTVNITHTLATLSDIELRFVPGATVKIGPTASGLLLTTARVFLLDTCTRVTITGLSVLAPTTPLLGTPDVERGIVQFYQSADCALLNSTFVLTNVWAPSNTWTDGYSTYQFAAYALFIKGPASLRNRMADCVVTGGGGCLYSYLGASGATVSRVVVNTAPENGFLGTGNGTGWAQDNVLEDCTVNTSARIGIEDWSKIRRTSIRNCRVYSPALMGISCVGAATRIITPYVEGTPSYAGLELSSTNVVVSQGRINITTVSTNQGIIVDGNTAIGNGDTTSVGTYIVGTEIHGGQFGITQATNINVGQIALVNCRIYDWVQKGIQLQDVASGGLPGLVTGAYLANALPTTTTRIGIQVGTGARVSDCEVRILAAANGGTSLDIPIYFGSNDQRWSRIRVDGTGVSSPSVPLCYSGGATPSGVSVDGVTLTGGAALSLQYLVSPTARNLVGSNITWGSGGAATSPVQVAVEGGVVVWSGAGSPESVVTAVVGSLYHRTDGSTGTSLYVKETGSGNTGWVAPISAGGGTITGNLRVNGNAGFYNTAPVAKPTVSGSRGGNAALASALTALAALGLVTDSSSA